MVDDAPPTREPDECLIHRGLGRVEFFDFSTQRLDGLQTTLDAMAGEGRGRFSFHAPIHRPEYFPYNGVTCFFLSEDAAKRELSFRLLAHTLDRAKAWGAEYVVTHLTFGLEDTTDENRAHELAAAACARIAEMSRDSSIPVDLEFAAYTDSFHRAGPFAEMTGAHPELGVCIDVGHAFIGAAIRGRDFFGDMAALAPAARSLHLWNTKGAEHARANHHTPLHPSQRPEDGWIDVERVLGIVLEENPAPNVIFEYPVDETTTDIEEGYDWIAALIS